MNLKRRYYFLDVIIGLPVGLGLFAIGAAVASRPRCTLFAARRPSPRLQRKAKR